MVAATRAVPPDAPDEEVLRAACRAFLQFLADEPAFARAFYIGMPTAGPRAVARFDAAERRFAEMTAKWHRRARARHPDWPAVPDDVYLAIAGAIAELVRTAVRNGQTRRAAEAGRHAPVPAPGRARRPPLARRGHLAAAPGAGQSPISPSLACPLRRLRAIVRRWISSVPS